MRITRNPSSKPPVRQARRKVLEPDSLRRLMTGGDRRSLARSNDALLLVRADKSRVADLVRLADDDDWLVVMRAMDLLEKLAHEHSDWIQRYRKPFIGSLAAHASWEIRPQISRALPLLRWTPRQRREAIAVLQRYVDDPQKFVKVRALDSLARFAELDASLTPMVDCILKKFAQSDSAALRSRARRIRDRRTRFVTGAKLWSAVGRTARGPPCDRLRQVST
jgi:hypothetical protein